MAKSKYTFSAPGETVAVGLAAATVFNGAIGLQKAGASGSVRLLVMIADGKLSPVKLTDFATKVDVDTLDADAQAGWADVPGAVELFLEAVTAPSAFTVHWNYRDG